MNAPAAARGRKAENSRATQHRLIEVARRLFASRGYAATATEDLVAAARVTRGALYHHYADKRALFVAVSEIVARELDETIMLAAAVAGDPWAMMRAGARAFLEACRNPEFRRIVLVDGPSVLGSEEWRRLNGRYAFATVRTALAATMAIGDLPEQPLDPLTHLFVGSLYEAGHIVADSPEPEATIATFVRTLDGVMDAQRERAHRMSAERGPESTPSAGTENSD